MELLPKIHEGGINSSSDCEIGGIIPIYRLKLNHSFSNQAMSHQDLNQDCMSHSGVPYRKIRVLLGR